MKTFWIILIVIVVLVVSFVIYKKYSNSVVYNVLKEDNKKSDAVIIAEVLPLKVNEIKLK